MSHQVSTVNNQENTLHNNYINENPGTRYIVNPQHHLHSEKDEMIATKIRRKVYSIISAILILGFVSTLAIAAYIYNRTENSTRVCHTVKCQRSAQQLLSTMNKSIDPCENFYQFACGNFAHQNPTPKYRPLSDWFDFGTDIVYKNISQYLAINASSSDPFPVRQAKELYKQCVDTAKNYDDNFTPIVNLLQRIGLPILPPIENVSANFSLLETMVKSKMIFNMDFFVSTSLTIDPKNSTRYKLYLSKPSEIAPFPLHYTKPFEFDRKKREMTSELEDIEKGNSEEQNEDYEESFSTTSTESGAEADAYTIAFHNYALNVIRFVYNYSNVEWTNNSDKDFDNIIGNLTLVDLLMSKIMLTHFSNDSNTPIPISIKINDLQNLTNDVWPKDSVISKIDWKNYFSIMFSDVPEIVLNFDDENLDQVIVMKDLFYINFILKWIGSANPQVLELYMWWSAVTTVAPYTSSKIRKYWEEFSVEVTNNEIELPPRSLFCAETINNIYGMVTAYPQVNDTVKLHNIQETIDMVDNIKQAFQDNIKNIVWMDMRTRSATLEKLKKMKTCVGFPPWLNETEDLEEYYQEYEEVNITQSDFLTNILKISEITFITTKKTYREVIDIDDEIWSFTPMDVNAYNWLEGNRITIPVGILQFPFYEHGLQALNYGAIGSIIGHELTHGFDNTGKEYDTTGLANPWWTNGTMDEFHRRAKCFIEYYETFKEFNENSSQSSTSKEEDEEDEEDDDDDDDDDDDIVTREIAKRASVDLNNLNSKKGIRTLDENIADNGGLRNAFYAYQNYVRKNGPEPILSEFQKYSPEQLFFLAFAHTWCKRMDEGDVYEKSTDEHSPNHVRVWGTLTSSKEFADVWKCPPGSPMNPNKEKCEMW